MNKGVPLTKKEVEKLVEYMIKIEQDEEGSPERILKPVLRSLRREGLVLDFRSDRYVTIKIGYNTFLNFDCVEGVLG